ncbi:MAG: hypothetical protein P5702_07260 [Limnospira sp. PMC 1291.21]|uniref:hypothetical protein n=1 Tax=unclassified Limnospira TaxID=2642885 RepID=UPI0028E165F0|nr:MULTISPECIES: hypothetical protein [unclassified Limnospira]MDT9177284.1 hypothetical protein [Limnospira sp. PMC 1238.20]MDT9192450.1 hypothetical protein [Limnospira sp. PMC 1245.20]MDT9204366.1 hypothetical protein [Limnospira sp. PMC 1243.20]MDT9208000.1 hypothetical protein [Limnospira sp. PMC 1252.20]MDT9213073.1 hypothetical protein [Limnospira sp. PMC 1256.20]
MIDTLNCSPQQLAIWLSRLVEILRSQGGLTWHSFVQTVAGKTAIIEIDGIQLRLNANHSEPIQVDITDNSDNLESVEALNFGSQAETLRDLIGGRLTLDQGVAIGKIHLRGSLSELLGIHKLTMDIVAESAINPQLQRLWKEFDDLWFRPSFPPPVLSLEEQITPQGELIMNVPNDVLNIEVELK